MPDGFPQGPGSGVHTPAPAAIPPASAPSQQTAAVYRDKSGRVVVEQPAAAPQPPLSPAPPPGAPFAQGPGSGLIVGGAPSTPAPAVERQTAIVVRDPKTGEVGVIQPDEGHAEGGEIGGPIRGPGSGTSDSIVMNAGPGDFILKESAARRAGRRALDQLHGYAGGGMPIRVSNGEEYFPRAEVSRIGVDTLNAINGGAKVPHFAEGGDVDAIRREEALDRALGRYRQKWLHYRAAEHSAGDVGAARARVFGGDPGPSAGMENLVPGHGLDLRNVFQYRDGGWVPPKFDTGGDVDQSRFAGLFAPSGVSIPSMDGTSVDLSDLRNTLSPPISPTTNPDRSSSGGLHKFQLADSNGNTVARGRGDDEVLESLHRSAVKQQTTRAGREPYWRGA